MKVTTVKLEGVDSGVLKGAIPCEGPRVSWSFEGDEKDWIQEVYQIKVGYRDGECVEYEPTSSSSCVYVPWPGKALQSKEAVNVSVRVKGASGDFSDWSAPFTGVVGILTPWECPFISMKDQEAVKEKNAPVSLFRKEFNVNKNKHVKSARIFSTAAGIYDIEVNGTPVNGDFLSPGWTTYEVRMLHQVYDILDIVKAGANAIGVRVAAGWFSGWLNFDGGMNNLYGPSRLISAEISIEYDDGSVETVCTDESWKSNEGPIVAVLLYNGEIYDARLEIPGWSQSGLDDSKWKDVTEIPMPCEHVEPQDFPHVTVHKTLKAIKIFTTPLGKTVLDFGSNLAGFIKFEGVKAAKGHEVLFRHSEVLENGEICTRPLRDAKAEDTYIFKGDSNGESYSPSFTYHGFRYCEVNNWPENQDLNSLRMIAISSAITQIGDFECDNKLLNQLQTNVVSSARSNFLSFPSDCPQRDERLGWTGDIALFSPTACFLFDSNNFLASWCKDVWAEQVLQANNKLPFVPPVVVPDSLKFMDHWWTKCYCAIWQDCTIIVPKTLYDFSVDVKVLENQFESMTKWIDCIPFKKQKVLWQKSVNMIQLGPSDSHDLMQLGDWLDPSAPPDDPFKAMTDETLVADAFLFRILSYLAEVCGLLGHNLEKYQALRDQCKRDFKAEYITANGRIVSDSQTAYSLAITFDLYDDEVSVQNAGNRLAQIAKRSRYKIATGFAGTPYVLTALAMTGHTDVAYCMLLQQECPSWLYPISMGATTMWERWNSMMPDGTVNPGSMTSFNHYALGSAVTFLYEYTAGLKLIEPGYKKFEIAPVPGGGLNYSKLKHLTPFGELLSEWRILKNDFTLNVKVPLNTEAIIKLPGSSKKSVGSGSYSFTVRI